MLNSASRGQIRFFGPPEAPVDTMPEEGDPFYKPQSHSHTELIFGLHGNSEILVNNRWLRFSTGPIRVFLPGMIHSERYGRKKSSYAMLWTLLSPQLVAFHITSYEPDKKYHLAGRRLALKLPPNNDLITMTDRPKLADDPQLRLHFQALLMDALCRALPIMDNKSNTDDKEIPYYHQILDQIINHLNDHLAFDISLTELAAMVHYSPCHLNLLFRRRFGIPIRQYLIQQRMKHTAHLLKTTPREIKQIAYQVGFHDPLYFSRLFRQLYGSSPSDFRLKQ